MSGATPEGENEQGQEAADTFARHGGSRRYAPPAQLPGATAFSKQGKIRGTRWLFEAIERLPWVAEALAEVEIDRHWGRRREPGRWAWMFLDFTTSDSVDVQPWYDKTDVAIWQLAGFARKPSYPTVYERFTELEERWPQYEAAAGRLIQHAIAQDDRVGAYVHIDSTEAETHSAFIHDCDPAECEWAERDRRRSVRRARRRRELDELAGADQPPARLDLSELDTLISTATPAVPAVPATDAPAPGRTGGRAPAYRPDRLPVIVPRADRQAKAEEEPHEGADYGTAEEVEIGRKYLRIKVNGHWYRSLDTTAGARAYAGRNRRTVRFWLGYYNAKITDHYTGGALVIGLYSASKQEYDCYEDMLDRLEGVLGRRPKAMVGDRGYSVVKVFRLNTERGIASVFPWRKGGRFDKRIDNVVLDRHGIPRCKHCGSPTEFVRFAHEPQPRLWFMCVGQATPRCVGPQSLACSHDWRALLPLWRNDPVYMELRSTHGEYEAIHDYWRDRYKVAPASLGQRPKRRGKEWQQLRASAALVVEWLRICYREGWLDGERQNRKQPRATMQRGTRAAVHLRAFRTRTGLNAPYGPKAVAAYGSRRFRRTPHERWLVQRRWAERQKAQQQTGRRRASS